MKTVVINNIPKSNKDEFYAPDNHPIRKAAQVIRDGGLIAFPTETVYGLGANALIPAAVENIFKTKGRPDDNPLIVHLSNPLKIKPLVLDIPDYAQLLINEFMPGPITLVFNKSNIIPDVVTAGLQTVAIRVPSHPLALFFLSLADVPIAAPSANLSGKPSPTSANHVLEDFNGKIPYIIDGGDCQFGLESTVVDTTGLKPVILRPGAITADDIIKCCGDIGNNIHDFSITPKSPGMKYKHYSPNAQVIAVPLKDTAKKTAKEIQKNIISHIPKGKKLGIYASDEVILMLKKLKINFEELSFGDYKDINKASAEFFRALRKGDKLGLDVIIVQTFPEDGLGQAYMNRLSKAAIQQEKKIILFVCTGNTCRSPMAEYYFNSFDVIKTKNYRAKSAGIHAFEGDKATRGAIKAMDKLFSIDLKDHLSSYLNREQIENASFVLAMTNLHKLEILRIFPEYKYKVYTLREFVGVNLDVDDPFGLDDESYINTAQKIANLTNILIDKLK